MSKAPDLESYPPSQQLPFQQSSSPTLVILTIVLLVLFFTGLFLIFFWRCLNYSLLRNWGFGQTQSAILNPSSNEGLDPSLLQSFPVFLYSSVKDLREDKYGLECAICLLEFEDDSLLRMLTICCHVFHKECIDLWLTSNITCPVCRRDLDLLIKAAEKTPVLSEHGSMHENTNNAETSREEDVRIDIRESNDEKDDHQSDNDRDKEQEEHNNKVEYENSGFIFKQKLKGKQKDVERFSRSHSTGHSIISIRGGGGESERDGDSGGGESERGGEAGGGGRESIDRHTLRFPEHIKAKLLRGHHCTRSCTTFKEMTKDGTCICGFAEVSGSPSVNNARKST